jgi:hypothetical protein
VNETYASSTQRSATVSFISGMAVVSMARAKAKRRLKIFMMCCAVRTEIKRVSMSNVV